MQGSDTMVYDTSRIESGGCGYSLARAAAGKRLLVRGRAEGFEGEAVDGVLFCPLTPRNAAEMRARLHWLRPALLGLRTSFGFGDRLGLATPGHVRAARRFPGIAPIFAQQSVRENQRTRRTPQQVLDDAMWGLLQEGWREPWGADADHLKTPAAMDSFIDAGYTLYTIDPGDHVDNAVQAASAVELEEKVRALPWETLEDTARDAEQRYVGRSIDLGHARLSFDRETVWRAAAKYARAIAHTVKMCRHLRERLPDEAFELEVSVDETDTPTSPPEHYYIAQELSRLSVRWVSLAPRFVGRFEKGVDYIGDLGQLDAEVALHAAIARKLGPYKLSLHSGSDKFAVYAPLARHAGELVHVKTAGTSYLEALRIAARLSPPLFREILALARARFETDRATYRFSADLAKVPSPETLRDDELPGLLEQFDARQVLHMTFGSVLGRFGEQLKALLAAQEEDYYAALEAHFVRHLTPFEHPTGRRA